MTMPTINALELAEAGGSKDATHAVFHPDGSLYFCVKANLDEEREVAFWEARGMTVKRVAP